MIPLPTSLLYILLYLIPLPMHNQLLHLFIISPLQKPLFMVIV